jgi:chemotaxis protein MotB
MAARARRHGGNGLEAWPGYVDALSTLLMVIIFVLLVFVLAQAFLSVALSGRDKALDKVNHQLAELTDALSLERGHSAELQASVAQLNKQLASSLAARNDLSAQLAALQTQAQQTAAERDSLRTQLAQTGAQVQSAQDANQKLTAQLSDAQQRLKDMQQQMAEADRTIKADKETIDAKLSDLAKLAEQTRALTALRDQLEKQAQDAAAHAMTEQDRRKAVELQLADEKKLGDSAKAQIALLSQQIDQLKSQLAGLSKALDLAEANGRDKDVQIANLGQKLNAALAAKVEELQQYRSEFFGKLRKLLANRPGIEIVGDRFVFQSEVLFPVGSADLTPQGVNQITALAISIKDIAREIPPGMPWILRVDGHTDPQPIRNSQFASNWELSAARAISVVKLLIQDGVSPEHLAATGFGQFQPLDPADTPEAYAKDRRIELRLTDR